MLVALQAGRRDLDHEQSLSVLTRFLNDNLHDGDTIAYVDQPLSILDRVEEMNVTSEKIKADFMLHGTAAVCYALDQLMDRADRCLVLQASDDPSPMDEEFRSYAEFFELPTTIGVFHYERAEMT